MTAKKLSVESLVQGERWLANDVSVREKLAMLQQSETIPYVNIEYIRKAIKAERRWKKIEARLCGW